MNKLSIRVKNAVELAEALSQSHAELPTINQTELLFLVNSQQTMIEQYRESDYNQKLESIVTK